MGHSGPRQLRVMAWYPRTGLDMGSTIMPCPKAVAQRPIATMVKTKASPDRRNELWRAIAFWMGSLPLCARSVRVGCRARQPSPVWDARSGLEGAGQTVLPNASFPPPGHFHRSALDLPRIEFISPPPFFFLVGKGIQAYNTTSGEVWGHMLVDPAFSHAGVR